MHCLDCDVPIPSGQKRCYSCYHAWFSEHATTDDFRAKIRASWHDAHVLPTANLKQKIAAGRRTDLERLVEAALHHQGWPYRFEYQIGHYFVDFALPAQHVVVEVDGAYWHNKPGAVERDRRKDAYLSSKGWHVLRLDERTVRRGATKALLDPIGNLSLPAAQRPLSL